MLCASSLSLCNVASEKDSMLHVVIFCSIFFSLIFQRYFSLSSSTWDFILKAKFFLISLVFLLTQQTSTTSFHESARSRFSLQLNEKQQKKAKETHGFNTQLYVCRKNHYLACCLIILFYTTIIYNTVAWFVIINELFLHYLNCNILYVKTILLRDSSEVLQHVWILLFQV